MNPVLLHSLFYLGLALILGLNAIYHDQLYIYSLTYIKWQQDYGNQFFHYYFLFWNYMGNGMLYYILIGFTYAFGSRARSLYHLLILGVLLFMMGIGKNMYAEPRPFWSDADIDSPECTLGFGNPSGHNMFSFGATLGVFLDLFHYSNWESPVASWRKNSGYYASSLSFVIITAISIGYGRIYEGAHSID